MTGSDLDGDLSTVRVQIDAKGLEHARRLVARQATNSADATALLDMLGLLPTGRPEYRDELGRVRHPLADLDPTVWWHGMLAPVPVAFLNETRSA